MIAETVVVSPTSKSSVDEVVEGLVVVDNGGGRTVGGRIILLSPCARNDGEDDPEDGWRVVPALGREKEDESTKGTTDTGRLGVVEMVEGVEEGDDCAKSGGLSTGLNLRRERIIASLFMGVKEDDEDDEDEVEKDVMGENGVKDVEALPPC